MVVEADPCLVSYVLLINMYVIEPALLHMRGSRPSCTFTISRLNLLPFVVPSEYSLSTSTFHVAQTVSCIQKSAFNCLLKLQGMFDLRYEHSGQHMNVRFSSSCNVIELSLFHLAKHFQKFNNVGSASVLGKTSLVFIVMVCYLAGDGAITPCLFRLLFVEVIYL